MPQPFLMYILSRIPRTVHKKRTGAQRRAVVEAKGLPIYEQAGTLRHAFNTITR
jgi:hypothetical protein